MVISLMANNGILLDKMGNLSSDRRCDSTEAFRQDAIVRFRSVATTLKSAVLVTVLVTVLVVIARSTTSVAVTEVAS